MVEAGAERIRNATSRAVPDDSQKRIGLLKLFENIPGVVDRAVVDDHNFVAKRTRAKRARGEFHEAREVLGFILRGHQDGDVDLLSVPPALDEFNINGSCSMRRAIHE
jgi:hypothetical protein